MCSLLRYSALLTQLRSVLQDVTPPQGCKVVSEQWLRACKASSQLLPVDRFLLSNSSARAGTRPRSLATRRHADCLCLQATAHSGNLQPGSLLRARLPTPTSTISWTKSKSTVRAKRACTLIAS